MDEAGAARTRERRWDKHPDLVCAACSLAPTCPQLTDSLWAMVWRRVSEQLTRALVCSTPLRCAQIEGHAPGCETRTGRVRQLLCLECAELLLERQLTVDDLEACVANYATYVMLWRSEAMGAALAPMRASLASARVEVERLRERCATCGLDKEDHYRAPGRHPYREG